MATAPSTHLISNRSSSVSFPDERNVVRRGVRSARPTSADWPPCHSPRPLDPSAAAFLTLVTRNHRIPRQGPTALATCGPPQALFDILLSTTHTRPKPPALAPRPQLQGVQLRVAKVGHLGPLRPTASNYGYSRSHAESDLHARIPCSPFPRLNPLQITRLNRVVVIDLARVPRRRRLEQDDV